MRTFENLVFNWSVDNLPMELEPNPFTQSSGSTKNLNERDESLAAIEITTLAIIFLLALIGNLFVLIALWRQMKFRSPSRMYLFMMHLSIADVLVAIFNILPQMLWKITFRFQGGDLLCRAVKYMQVMVLYLSTYILVMMAVDRYRAVCWTSNLYWNSVKLAKVMVVIAWIMSLVFAVPQPFIFRITQLPSNDSKVIQDCWATFVEPWGGKAYVTWFVLAAFIMPLMILSFCYGVICYKIWTYNPDKSHTSSSQARQNSACPSDNPLVTSKQNGDCRRVQQEISSVLTPQRSVHLRRNGRNQISHAKMKTIKLTLIVIICFFFCWAPFCVTQLVMAYSPTKQGKWLVE